MLSFSKPRERWLVFLLTLGTFFLLLGTRALNEPDEGRYGEIAREMVETGDWLVPHFWYLPHLDKPPITYWFEAVSLKVFGLNEWAVRLPVALAGLSGLWATFLLARSMAGPRIGWISILILQTSFLYLVMARFLTTDIFLTQFVTWAMYFFWESWVEVRGPEPGWGRFLSWHLAGWVAVSLAFLVKGPIGFAIPVVALATVATVRRREPWSATMLIGGWVLGLALLLAMVLPWFTAVFKREPQAAHFMIFGQAVGHLLGTTITNRRGNLLYFFGIIAVGLMPWSCLLIWLWRRDHWRNLSERAQDAWLLLSVWAVFTFTLFSLSHAKLPAYILPIFPALAVMLAWRFFSPLPDGVQAGNKFWRICLGSAFIFPAVFPLILKFAFHNPWSMGMVAQILILTVAGIVAVRRSRFWHWTLQVTAIVVVAWGGVMFVVAEIPQFETTFHANQTLRPLGQALREHYTARTPIVCWARLPQGLPFYAAPAISKTNLPYFGAMDWQQVPFEYPDNRDLAGSHILADNTALDQMLQSQSHVLLVAVGDSLNSFTNEYPNRSLHLVAVCGQWRLFEYGHPPEKREATGSVAFYARNVTK